MSTEYLRRTLRCLLLLAALAVCSPAPVIAAQAKPPVATIPRTYLVRYLVFTISPPAGKAAWPDEAPAIFHESPLGLPTIGSAGFSPIELPFPSQLASREKAQGDLEALQRKDALYRYDLLFWGEERSFDGDVCLPLDGPAPDKWQTVVALSFALHSAGPEMVDLREAGKIRVSPGAMAGWEGPVASLRLGKTYTEGACGHIPLKQIFAAFCIVPDPGEGEIKPPPPIRGGEQQKKRP